MWLRPHDRLLPHRLLRDRCGRPRRSHRLLHRRREIPGCLESPGQRSLHAPPQYGFPGLRPGDRWCVCAARWLQVQQAGAACPVVLEATHENHPQDHPVRPPDPARRHPRPNSSNDQVGRPSLTSSPEMQIGLATPAVSAQFHPTQICFCFKNSTMARRDGHLPLTSIPHS